MEYVIVETLEEAIKMMEEYEADPEITSYTMEFYAVETMNRQTDFNTWKGYVFHSFSRWGREKLE